MSAIGSGYKVLVIDDSNTIRRSAEIFLKQGGHEVLLAEDGYDALSNTPSLEESITTGTLEKWALRLMMAQVW